MNAFFNMVQNMVMKFHNFDIFYKFCYIFDLSSALASRFESIKKTLIISASYFQMITGLMHFPSENGGILK